MPNDTENQAEGHEPITAAQPEDKAPKMTAEEKEKFESDVTEAASSPTDTLVAQRRKLDEEIAGVSTLRYRRRVVIAAIKLRTSK